MPMIHLSQQQITTGRVPAIELSDQLTVAVRFRSTGSGAERSQALVAQWTLASDFDAFSSYDATHTDGLVCAGYMGGVFDGRYIYFSPNRDSRLRDSVHGRVLRYDTLGEFDDPSSYTAFDVEHVTHLRTVNYYGAAFDGRYVYFSPQDEGHQYHSRVLRYDTRSGFKDRASWQSYDMGMIHSHQGIAFDGRFVYFPPGYEGTSTYKSILEDKHSGQFMRYDTHSEFANPDSWQRFDSKPLSERATNFDGAAVDGRYVYFVPLSNGLVLRFDTRGRFEDSGSWHSYDVSRFRKDGWFVGAVFDGRYLYLVAYSHGVIVRCDTNGDFSDDESWSTRDVSGTAGLDTGGFDGGLFDGRYAYFMPWNNPQGKHHSNFLRFDTLGDFGDVANWTACDAGHVGGMKTIGYNGGVFDGRFLYGAPVCDDDEFHGRILRYDTLAEGTFALRHSDYGHNGGLCAAVPGPSFIVNTDRGPISAAAHQALGPGAHEVAGVYSQGALCLIVDGAVVTEIVGSGALQRSEAEIAIGQFADSAARFEGSIEAVVIGDGALDVEQISRALRSGDAGA